MKNINIIRKRITAVSLAVIISLNVSPLVLAEEITAPHDQPGNIEMEETSTNEETEVNVEEVVDEVEESVDGNIDIENEYINNEDIETQQEDLDMIDNQESSTALTMKVSNIAELEVLQIEGNGNENTRHVLSARAKSQNGVLYKFYVKDLSTNKWSVIQDYSERASVAWIPKQEGKYWYGVHIKDKESKLDKDTHKYTPITIKSSNAAELEVLQIEGNENENTRHVLSARAKSPNGVLYKFYVKDLSTNKWSVIQDYSERASAAWVPKKGGDYWYGVHIKDKKSKLDKDTHKYIPITIKPLDPAELEVLQIEGNGYEGTRHVLSAKGKSKNGVLYKFYVKDLSTDKWTVIQDYSERASAAWVPNKVGDYMYGVHIKDKKSKLDKDDHLYTPFTINPPIYYNTTEYNDTLEQALDKQDGKNTSYRDAKIKATKDEIRQYLDPNRFLQFVPEVSSKPGKKIATVTTEILNIRSGPSTSYDVVGRTSKGKTHEIMGELNGWYLINMGSGNGWVSGALISVKIENGAKSENKHLLSIEITANSLNLRKEPNTTSAVLGSVSNGNVYVVLEDKNGWYKINAGTNNAKNIGWVSSKYVKLINDVPREMYQFMILDGQAGATSSQLNQALKGKGILEGKGAAFIEGSKKFNVNELYLMAHAFLETGNGTSKLSTGVLVSQVDGKPVTPKITYNMYGIGARNKDALRLGSEYAYTKGWFTPEIAIREGAHWISNNYINSTTYRQNTLYKMKFNPATPGTHQYATDVGWAMKQTRYIDLMSEVYRGIKGVILRFDIPKYR